MAMERLTALEKRVDVAEAYETAMPRPHGFYVVLAVHPWSTPEEREERLLQARRSVLLAVESAVEKVEDARWMNVRCFLVTFTPSLELREHFLIALIGYALPGAPRLDVGALYLAISRRGTVREWRAFTSRAELTWFLLAVEDEVSYAPVRAGDGNVLAGNQGWLQGSSADEAVMGFRRLRDSLTSWADDTDIAQAVQWAAMMDPRMYVFSKPNQLVEVTANGTVTARAES